MRSEPSTPRMVVARASYLPTDPTVDSQIVHTQGVSADVLFNASSPKFAAQAINKLHDIGWSPMHFSASRRNINAVFKVAGLEKTPGIIPPLTSRIPAMRLSRMTHGVKDYLAFMAQYAPGIDVRTRTPYGLSSAQTMVRVLEQCAMLSRGRTSWHRRRI